MRHVHLRVADIRRRANTQQAVASAPWRNMDRLIHLTSYVNGRELDRPRAWPHSTALGPTGWSRNATCVHWRVTDTRRRANTTQAVHSTPWRGMDRLGTSHIILERI